MATTPALSPAMFLRLQKAAGNAAVQRLAVQRCGPTNPDCGCAEAEQALEPSPVVQRDTGAEPDMGEAEMLVQEGIGGGPTAEASDSGLPTDAGGAGADTSGMPRGFDPAAAEAVPDGGSGAPVPEPAAELEPPAPSEAPTTLTTPPPAADVTAGLRTCRANVEQMDIACKNRLRAANAIVGLRVAKLPGGAAVLASTLVAYEQACARDKAIVVAYCEQKSDAVAAGKVGTPSPPFRLPPYDPWPP